MDASALWAGASHLTADADKYENDATIESLWVMKACRYADIHLKLICSNDSTKLTLTKHDDRIRELFKTRFPDFNIETIDPECLKSPAAKEKWRAFCEELKDIEDYNYGTLLRLNSHDEYTQENTILVTRVQFLAIEICRNREGLNNSMWTNNLSSEGELKVVESNEGSTIEKGEAVDVDHTKGNESTVEENNSDEQPMDPIEVVDLEPESSSEPTEVDKSVNGESADSVKL